MAEVSNISWTDASFNAWWGCEKIPGKDGRPSACDHCYAADLDNRFHGADNHWQKNHRKLFGDKHWNQPRRWNDAAQKAGKIMRVFTASMSDVFEKLPGFVSADARTLDTERARLFKLIEETPSLDWLILTKRPQFINEMIPTDWRSMGLPINTVIMATVESADFLWRIEKLAGVQADRRGVSMEPLFGKVDLMQSYLQRPKGRCIPMIETLSWVITGGESGRQARPAQADWYRMLREQCQRANVPFHFKQWGEWGPLESFVENAPQKERYPYDAATGMAKVGKHTAGRLLDGRTHDGYPFRRGTTAEDYLFTQKGKAE